MVVRSQIFAWIAGAVAALSILLMFIALVADTLFAGEMNETKVRCGWNELRTKGGSSVKWADDLEQNTAGQIWLCFGIIAVMWGLAGALCSCIAWIPSFRLPGTGCMFLAGISAFVAAASAFAFWADSSREYVCADRLRVGASVILAFIAGSLLLFATCFMCVSHALATGEQCGSSPSCYDSYGSYKENYCQPVQMQGAKCVPVGNDCAPKCVPCAPASPQGAPRCVPVCEPMCVPVC